MTAPPPSPAAHRLRLYEILPWLCAGGAFFVFPDYLAVPMSVEPLVMVLLGGVQALAGAPVGAAIYKLLDTVVTKYTEYWQLVLGAILILLVLVFPRGILGMVADRRRA